MKNLIKKYYLMQLAISFLLSGVIMNLFGFINNIDDHSAGQLVIISMVGAFLFMTINAIVNAMNFIRVKIKSNYLAFYLPALIWFLSFGVYACFFAWSENPEGMRWFHLVYWLQPMLYNLKLEREVAKISRNETFV